MTTNFCHLHNHSEYSLLDGMTTPEEMASIVSSNGQIAAAITDHGTMSGILRFQEACKKQGIKGLFGIEAYYVPSLVADTDDKKAERFHLILIAKNQEGLYKLFKLNKKAWTEGFYYKPRIEWADLEHLSGDVIVLSGCMASYLSRNILGGNFCLAETIAKDFKSRFGGDYYLELQPWNDPDLNSGIVKISNTLDIPIVGTLDCHYPTKKDKGIEEVLLMMGQMPGLNAAMDRYAKEHATEAKNHTDLIDKMNCMYPDRKLRFEDIAVYLQSTEEVVESFKSVGLTDPAIWENTMEIADKCKAELPTKRNLLPKFSRQLNSDEYLKELAFFGLEEKGLADKPEYVDRLNMELQDVLDLKFSDYFLIVWDIVKWADNQGIRRGPARGSVGGSLLAFCLEITIVDPIVHGLLWTRFLNRERVSMPDIDLDFADNRREEVKSYIKKRWGAENVASIATYIEFKPKGLVKDIARVFGVPYEQANALSPMFETLDELRISQEGGKFLKEYPEVITVADRLSGRIKNTGMHAAGMVVSSVPLWQVTPVETRAEKSGDERVEVTAVDMNQAELLGLLKMDVLGVKALAVVDDCIKKVKEKYDRDVEHLSVGLDDPLVYNDITSGHTVGVFQAEASPYRNLILEMGISSFYDLSASNALVRPGAFLTQGEQYIACKQGRREVKYPHPVLEDILKETYGTFIYQEQIMQTSEVLAGFTTSEADTLRKIIGKKRDAAEFEPFHEKFVANAQKYITEKAAENLWADFEKTSLYLFNKSHAVGYSILSYQTAWLKHYYPLEFIWALLANENEKEQMASYLIEAKRLGIQIEGPDVNISGESFTLDGDKVRFGLKNVSACGPAGIAEIMAKRPFKSVEEMREKCKKTAVKQTLMDNFEKLDAFQSMGVRSQYDSKKYWLSLLNCPVYMDDDKFLADKITPMGSANVEMPQMYLVRGLVKSTKRKPNYYRVELEDTTGSVTVFGSQDMAVKSRDYIIALVGDKTLHAYIDANSVEDDFNNDFAKFLREIEKPFIMPEELLSNGVGGHHSDVSLVRIISNRVFKTKTGKVMSNCWVYYPSDNHFQKCVIFSTVYGRNTHNIAPWNWLLIKAEEARGGGMAINDIIDLKSYCDLKELNFEALSSKIFGSNI